MHIKVKSSNIFQKLFLSHVVSSLFTNISLKEIINVGIILTLNYVLNLNNTKKSLKRKYIEIG